VTNADSSDDASRRTLLAGERTFLAWTRSGLGALAVAIAMGRILPALRPLAYRWLYLTAGVGYAILGMGFILYGVYRQHLLEELLATGRFRRLPRLMVWGVAGYGIALGLLTMTLLVLPL
jgi:uncharacterized membrane protein YidH (DUF202 family)